MPDSPTNDELLAGVLSRMVDEQRAGQWVDLAPYLAEHPELADELRELWGAAQLAENLAPSLPRSFEAVPTSDGGAPSLTLPRHFGDYELLEAVGRGGKGIVYRARQRALGRTVAVKMLLGGVLETPQNLARFRVEAAATARLDHPHVVTVLEVGEAEGQAYYTMPFIAGTTLAKRIAEGLLADREAAELMIPVCRAVAHVHLQGTLHRDLKPSNILIDRSGRPFVSDFGLAKRVDMDSASGDATGLTRSGDVLGTPGYMAPEQAAGMRGEVSPRTDVYSLGAVLYACLTGRPPFQAATPIDAILMILEQDPLPPRLLNSRIDPDLEMIILKAMQKPPDLRYHSADELADDLEAFLHNEPISARSSQFSQVISRAFRPTHHAGVLENWGLLWIWHAAALLTLCLITNAMQLSGVDSRIPYLSLWTMGLGAWAIIFWNLRRRAGPVTFVERQIAHIWAASMACSISLYGVEYLLDLPVLKLSPVLALIAAAVFVAKAGVLSGEFYVQATALFATAIPMALYPQYALAIFGIVSALCFAVPGWKFFQLSRKSSGVQGAERSGAPS